MTDSVDRVIRSDLDGRADITAAEARAIGLLQELNRLYLHPLGYALGVRFRTERPEPDDAGVFFMARTADEEGFIFPEFEPHEVDRGHQLADQYRSQTAKREFNLGYPNGIQPLHDSTDAEDRRQGRNHDDGVSI